MAVDRSWSPAYLQKQKEAIWWLYKLGLTPEEIREMRWGPSVDDADKVLLVRRMVTFEKVNLKTWQIERSEYEKTFKVPLRHTECEWFFLKSKIPCPWMFTRERPKTWRKEGSKESLYSLAAVEKICSEIPSIDPCKRLEKGSINLLTKVDKFANIEVSKLNITKMKTEELESRTLVPETAAKD